MGAKIGICQFSTKPLSNLRVARKGNFVRHRTSRMVHMALAVGVAMAAAITIPIAVAPAGAAHRTPDCGPSIDRYATDDPQSTCESSPKPGVVYVKDLLNTTYGSHVWGISRACNPDSVSEHEEGR